MNKVPFYGAAILCLDDENVQQILPPSSAASITYGVSAQANLLITVIQLRPSVQQFPPAIQRRRSRLRFTLRVPGIHNVLNATAAVAVALELEVEARQASARGWPTSRGVDRRFQMRGGEGRHRHRRLRPPSHGDPRHSRRGPRLPASTASTRSFSRTGTPARST